MMKRFAFLILGLLAISACRPHPAGPACILQISLGGWHAPRYTADEIIGRIDSVSRVIPVEKVILAWNPDKELYRKVGDYLHSKGIRMLVCLPVFAETEEVCDNTPAVDLWGEVPSLYDPAAGDAFRFNCPSDPNNAANILALFDRMFGDCGFDGVLLDRIRTQSFVCGVSGVLNCGCPACSERYAAEGVDLERVKAAWEEKGDRFFSVSGYSPEEGFRFEDSLAAAFFKAKGHIVSNSVATIADSLRNRGLEVGLDLFAPFLAPFVGQDYAILTRHADFIKPMLYRRTFAPAGMPYEYELMRKSVPGAAGYPEFAMDAAFLESQLKALDPWPCDKFPGIDVNYIENTAPTSPEYVAESLKAVTDHGFKGAVLSWNVMAAPDSHIAAIGTVR